MRWLMGLAADPGSMQPRGETGQSLPAGLTSNSKTLGAWQLAVDVLSAETQTSAAPDTRAASAAGSGQFLRAKRALYL